MKQYKKIISRNILFILLSLSPALLMSQEISISDSNFEQALIDLDYDSRIDGNISEQNAKKIKVLPIGNRDISDLSGIEFFTNLEELYCNDNNLSHLDLKSNLNLRILNCNNNELTELDLTLHDRLEILRCDNNNLKSLDLRNNVREIDTTSFVFNNSVYGIIKDEHDIPVLGATVTYAGFLTKSNALGYYSFENIAVPKQGLPISVYYTDKSTNYYSRKKTYFKRTVSFIPVENVILQKDIKLALKKHIESINSETGGEAIIDSGNKIVFPENSVVDINGELYSGSFNVYANYIDPNSSKFNEELPGFLLGQTLDEEVFALRSFGIFQAEIETPEGIPLQIADGKTVTLSTELSTNLLTEARATIPMWYLDENTGIWKEEGSAQLEGTSYISEVSHLSTWNWDDLLKAPIFISGTVVHSEIRSDIPISGITICVNGFDSLRKQYCTFTSGGYFQFLIPRNTPIELFFSIPPNACSSGGTFRTKAIGSFDEDTDLGDISLAIPYPYNLSKGTGKVVDLTDKNIEEALIEVIRRNSSNIAAAKSRAALDGTFIISSINCKADPQEIQLQAYDIRDPLNIKSSKTISVDFSKGDDLNLGKIIIGDPVLDNKGGIGTLEYIKFDLDGEPFSFVKTLNDDDEYFHSFFNVIQSLSASDDGLNWFSLTVGSRRVDSDPVSIFADAINTKANYFRGRIGDIVFAPENVADTWYEYLPNATSKIVWKDVPPRTKYDYSDICNTEKPFVDSDDPYIMRGTFDMEATDTSGIVHQFTNGSIQIIFDVNEDLRVFEGCY